MRFVCTFLALTAVVVGIATGSRALAAKTAVEATPIPASVKPDFSKMMLGKWNCSVMSSRRPGPYFITSTSMISPDGYWLITQGNIHKTSWSTALTSQDRVTYDPSTKQWIDLNYDTTGGYGVTTSSGWNGNNIVWTAVLAPKSASVATTNPTTITRVNATRFTSIGSFTETSGRLITVKTTCTKG